MADEVIIEEYEAPPAGFTGSVYGRLIGSQVLDIGTLSSELNARTRFVRLASKGTGFWYVVGGSDASAAADTDGNRWLGGDTHIDIAVGRGDVYIDTAADA